MTDPIDTGMVPLLWRRGERLVDAAARQFDVALLSGKAATGLGALGAIAGFPISNLDSGHATSTVGGPDFGWLSDEDVLGLPIAKASLTVDP